ncbi:hypothetical protein BD408DRAFT_435531 [Parasitella parasitica]|nr:hypothetical protein BD408DRAFT_435531 [Parasitella parasitica]
MTPFLFVQLTILSERRDSVSAKSAVLGIQSRPCSSIILDRGLGHIRYERRRPTLQFTRSNNMDTDITLRKDTGNASRTTVQTTCGSLTSALN